jgi:hypothetical protein
MSPAKQLQHLVEAQAHVRHGAMHVFDQEMRIVDLELHGHDATLARAVLENFRCTQAQFVAHRDLILIELGL